MSLSLLCEIYLYTLHTVQKMNSFIPQTFGKSGIFVRISSPRKKNSWIHPWLIWNISIQSVVVEVSPANMEHLMIFECMILKYRGMPSIQPLELGNTSAYFGTQILFKDAIIAYINRERKDIFIYKICIFVSIENTITRYVLYMHPFL
jgi:hypothetical protein